ncbi:SMC family ATPase [Nocardioides aestuarii]|uniref:Nuclease SbcCD subunit C n=1 Tax=Nocardioides aestuarii TaxID=252231 RepID=A0ABW4TRZ1_9ACTN
MRIHRLRIQAFGPFAGEVEVDLDTLSDAGLFLLTGATGAGKTSVLDAICFALYGAVPGDRQIAKRLRSDHAAPGVAPEVTLELTLAGRRLRIDRSPSWQRPKKRGDGTTTAQASVLVQERVDGTWVPRSSRLDEAGHLLSGLLGMTQTQFCQVQMLPQGRFQAFLRAGSDDRQRLLHQLFRTSRFEAVEAWLRDHRRSLGREAARHEAGVAALVNRTSEAARRETPSSWTLPHLAEVADEISPWADALSREADELHSSTVTRLDQAVGAEADARAALDDARALAGVQQRHRAALAELGALDAAAGDLALDLARLRAGRRAVPVLGHVESVHRATRRSDAARTLAARDLGRLRELLDQVRPDDLGAVIDDTTRSLATVHAALPRLAELDDVRLAVAGDQERLRSLADELGALDDELASLPAALADHAAAELDAQRAADSLAAAEDEVGVARERLAAGREVVSLLRRRTDAETLLRAAVDDVHARKEHWLDLQERRLSGMAAEIALGLASGHDCPVCGSADHPHPAQALPGSPDAEAVRRARSDVDDAEVVRHARQLALADLDARTTAARERTRGATIPVLERELADREGRASRLRARATRLPGLAARRERADERLAEVRLRVHHLHGDRASTASALAQREQRLTVLTDELDTLVDGTGHDTLPALAESLERRLVAARTAHRSHEDAVREEQQLDEVSARAAAAATQQGFDDPAAAQEAAEAAGDLDELQALVDRHRQRRAAAEATLADPDVRAAAAAAEPDLPTLVGDHEAAQAALRAAHDAEATARRRTARLDGLVADLHEHLAAWSPVRARHALADRLASLADGSSPDNRLRMRLSGYVLAARLAQVVAAANERLSAMLDGRYQLEHSDDRGAGETRGGLSLRVRDEWSGESRDPVTLSGGETFVVSLALALGLSDVISHEAGGAELDTLFVDEGFGTLDADSLDHVMDMLDSLRDGGRVVGVVSHVPELRDRIPAQLHVEKRRAGSRTRQASAPAPMR